MGDSFDIPNPRTNSVVRSGIAARNGSKCFSIVSGSKSLANQSLRQLGLLQYGKKGRGISGQLVLFLAKVAALEALRRISRSKCPCVWSGLQALQLVCYPPFKWIRRWNPFDILVKCMQMLSRPLLVLSIATAFSENPEGTNVSSDSTEVSPDLNDSYADSESHLESSSEQSTPNDSIDEEELYRYFAASDGNFTRLLSSVKKTIHWRETYRILSGQELEKWSEMIFWHGYDEQHRPCLIVRLGLACISLPSHDRPRFAQAVVSQVEHGVLHLVDPQNSQVTVLVDCEGLSPLRLPMHMVTSCSTLLLDHFPNRLGCLFVIRLPPIVRAVAQTFLQVLKPVTRRKLRFEGEMYQKVLLEHLSTLPSYLGGECTCSRCARLNIREMHDSHIDKHEETESLDDSLDFTSPHSGQLTEMPLNSNCDQVLRKAVLGVILFWVFVAFIAGLYDPESRPILPS